MVQHHFVSAWVPANGEERENYAREVSKNLYSVGTLVKLGTIESGKSVTDKAVLYSGPQDQDRLEQIAPGLELVVDYGWRSTGSCPSSTASSATGAGPSCF